MILKAVKAKLEGQSEHPVETIALRQAVIVDAASSKVEVLDVDAVEIVQCAWASDLGVFQVQLALGSYDASGAFRRDYSYGLAMVSWSRDQHPECWERYGLQTLQGIDFDNVKQWLHAEGAVAKASRGVWKLPDLESSLEDKVK
jgi:hypothetical protein